MFMPKASGSLAYSPGLQLRRMRSNTTRRPRICSRSQRFVHRCFWLEHMVTQRGEAAVDGGDMKSKDLEAGKGTPGKRSYADTALLV